MYVYILCIYIYTYIYIYIYEDKYIYINNIYIIRLKLSQENLLSCECYRFT